MLSKVANTDTATEESTGIGAVGGALAGGGLAGGVSLIADKKGWYDKLLSQPMYSDLVKSNQRGKVKAGLHAVNVLKGGLTGAAMGAGANKLSEKKKDTP